MKTGPPLSMWIIRVGSVSGNNITDYTYDIVKDESTFIIDTSYFSNPYSIKYTRDASILGTTLDTSGVNPIRNFTLNYKSYTIEHNGIIRNIKEIDPPSQTTDSQIAMVVEGNPFPELTGIFIPQYSFMLSATTGTIPFYIKPNEIEIEKFFSSLTIMQQNL